MVSLESILLIMITWVFPIATVVVTLILIFKYAKMDYLKRKKKKKKEKILE